MARKTQQNKITSPELWEQVNPDNKQLLEDFLTYLRSIQRSETTIHGYRNDAEIAFTWCLLHNKNKMFVDWTKRDIVAFQNWMLQENKNSPARVRRIKSVLSSLSNYIEAVLDDEFKDFRPIVRKIENPINQAVREKTVLTDEQCDELLDKLMEKGWYEKACCLALALCSGRRRAELVRFKVSYFDEENIIFGSLYKTPEKVKTKGRGNGKMLYCYTMSKKFKPYFDAWMKEREAKGVESEWLFPDPANPSDPRMPDTLNSWADTFTRLIGVDFYFHAARHYFTTHLSRSGLPDSVIKEILGWESLEMVQLYKDIDGDEEIGKYFSADGIKQVEAKSLDQL